MLAIVGKERPEVLAPEKMVVFDRCRTTFLEDRRREEGRPRQRKEE